MTGSFETAASNRACFLRAIDNSGRVIGRRLSLLPPAAHYLSGRLDGLGLDVHEHATQSGSIPSIGFLPLPEDCGNFHSISLRSERKLTVPLTHSRKSCIFVSSSSSVCSSLSLSLFPEIVNVKIIFKKVGTCTAVSRCNEQSD